MTRDHDLAMQFVKRDGVPLLFKSLKSSSGGVAGSQSYASIILRHIVEDPVVVRHIMREEVQRFFSHPRTRTVDPTGYVRALQRAGPTRSQSIRRHYQVSRPA